MFDHTAEFPRILNDAFDQAISSIYDSSKVLDNDDHLYGLDGVFSSIYLKGDVIGKVSLFIKSSAAAGVVARMLGLEDIQEDSPEVLDGVGEILNIVVGCFKQKVDPQGIKLDISVPSTRQTGVIPPPRWENVISHVFCCEDVHFKVIMCYRMATKEDKQIEEELPPKKKLSAADLLRAALAKK